MATYLILNVCFILAVILLLRISRPKSLKPWLFTLFGLIILTAIFDSVIINFAIVGYTESKLLGIYIGSAPIEDFFYAILAVILVPTLWNKQGDTRAK